MSHINAAVQKILGHYFLWWLLFFRNMGESAPGWHSFQSVPEPAANTQRYTETLQMEVFEERTGIITECLTFTATAVSIVIPINWKTCTCNICCRLDSSSDEEPIELLQRHRWSCATQKVLSSMPSRTAGEMKHFSPVSCWKCPFKHVNFHYLKNIPRTHRDKQWCSIFTAC